MNIQNTTHYGCTGCSACVQVCPNKAIVMQFDKDGFETPVVRKELCDDCGICANTCHATRPETKPNAILKAFYGWNLNEEARRLSSSGGIFAALANNCFNQNGVVYGASCDFESIKVLHTCSSPFPKILRSKYVQSSTTDAFAEMLHSADKAKKILFCGTPCQVAGLKGMLKGCDSNLVFKFSTSWRKC